jgi:hypothetical protein
MIQNQMHFFCIWNENGASKANDLNFGGIIHCFWLVFEQRRFANFEVFAGSL